MYFIFSKIDESYVVTIQNKTKAHLLCEDMNSEYCETHEWTEDDDGPFYVEGE